MTVPKSANPVALLAAQVIALAVAGLTLQGCQDAARPLSPTPMLSRAAAPAAPLVPRLIAPQATDPAINWNPPVNPNCSDPQCDHHHVWLDASRPSNGKLFVFMPGIAPPAPRPRSYQLVQQEAARLGYHVIGLMYQNSFGMGCAGSADPDCLGNARLESIDGVDRSSVVDVSRANSIDNRLTKLLLYLDAQFPGEGWSRFLYKGEPKWSQIALGGHSAGAAQAALIGKIRHVDRVVMFAGPSDVADAAQPAAWVSIGETPAAKYFDLVHIRDQGTAAIFANVRALDLERFGEPVQVELSQPPYHGTHILVTDLEPQGGYGARNPHMSTAVDLWTPLGPDGTPLLRDAWRYMLGSPSQTRDGDEDDDEP
jgi:hypothetical protein